MGGWYYPDGIEKDIDVSGISDEFLIYYHDQLHIFWKKVEDGFPSEGSFDWTFSEILNKHREILREMGKRALEHISPINRLDTVNGSIKISGKGKSAIISENDSRVIESSNTREVITLKSLSEKFSKKSPEEFISELSVFEENGKWVLAYSNPKNKKSKGKIIRSFDDKKLADEFMNAIIIKEILKKRTEKHDNSK